MAQRVDWGLEVAVKAHSILDDGFFRGVCRAMLPLSQLVTDALLYCILARLGFGGSCDLRRSRRLRVVDDGWG